MQAIAIQNLTKYYRKLKALDNVSIGVEPGEFFGFLGPNGAGKTTTIGVLTGLANYQAGSVRVFGKDVIQDYRQTRAMIGLVPQEFNFDPFLSAENILAFEGGYFGMPAKQARQRTRELLEFFDLWEKRKDGYKKLSGGMKRRLLLARALMHRPKILILDEPTAGVDLELRHQLWEFLKKINKQGTTIFLTTHYIEEAERLCSRIAVIHGGRIVADEPTDAMVRKMGGDRIELTLDRALAELPGELKALPVQLDAERKIVFDDTREVTMKVMKILGGLGASIEKIDLKRPTLEAAFLRLIGKKKNKQTDFTI